MSSPRGARIPHGQRAIEGPSLTVTQVRSEIGAKPRTRGTLRALGLRRIGASNTLPDRPEIRGMLARVPHLVEVTTNPGGAPGAAGATSGEPS
ncbi:MAG: 50S ribosomal protein L30 [Acidimicrobiales bacterium]